MHMPLGLANPQFSPLVLDTTNLSESCVCNYRDTMRSILNFPPNTRVEFKSHDSSIQQRSAIDEQRREKASQNQGTGSDRRVASNAQRPANYD